MPAAGVKRSEQRLLHPVVNGSTGCCEAVLVLHSVLTSVHLTSGNRPDAVSVLNQSVYLARSGEMVALVR